MIKSMYFLIVFIAGSLSCLTAIGKTDFEKQIESLPGVVSVEKIESHSFFKETYEIMFEQFLDHENKSSGTFNQRIILSLYSTYSPVVYVTEGYSAAYAEKGMHLNELSRIIQANQIIVEHRYFGESVPGIDSWEFLNIEQAVADLHRIYSTFNKIFTTKWIATGISKGGQNTIAYKAFYPNDMDGWVAYVGPVNFAIEDRRMQRFLRRVGTDECRDKIENFQTLVLENRESILPKLDSLIHSKEYTFSIPVGQVLDYCVLEYSFAFWQWGHNCASIPKADANYNDIFSHLIKVSRPDYFSIEGSKKYEPFFVQAANDFGYYGYSTWKFRKLLDIKNAKGYIYDVFLEGEPEFKYSNRTSKFIKRSIQKDGENLILIYGENDPWTAAGIEPKRRSKANLFVMPEGSHAVRIDSMSYEMQGEIYKLLEDFLGLN